jgi:serine/threonine protein kinase/formylglycine-generating enzyme required for sulfatase activity
MPVLTRCPNPACGKSYHLADNYQGRSVRCKNCGQKFTVCSDSVGLPTNPETLMLPGSTHPSRRRAAAPAELPEKFGRYRILKRLGEGGMGCVYLAHDTQLDRQVALKVPHFAPEDDPEILERFAREARAAATLSHPNLCPVFDVGDVGGIHFLTMAYIEGKPLSDFIDEKKPLPQRQVAAVVRKLALALHEAHQRGVVHRDLKPSNIMINQRREPVIMDFGLARRSDRLETRLTQNGEFLGTPVYMAPEQIKGDLSAVGPRSDMYSLGVILYQLLTGRLPFTGTPFAVVGEILTQEPEPPSKHRPDLDKKLETICQRAMAKDGNNRYATMATLAAALTEFLRPPDQTASSAARQPGEDQLAFQLFGDAARSKSVVRTPTLREKKGPPRRHYRWALVAGAAASAALIAGIILVVIKTKSGTTRIEVDDANPSMLVEIQTKEAAPVTGQRVASPERVAVNEQPTTVKQPNSTNQPATPRAMEGAFAGQEREDNSLSMKFCWCPAGTFTMGSPPEEPERRANENQTEVTLTHGFWLGKYAVTQAEFRKVMGTNPSHFCSTGGMRSRVEDTDTSQFPVENANWFAAMDFCRRLTDLENQEGRLPANWEYSLPTEAQREYACRAGTTTATAFGDKLGTLDANIDGSRPYNGAEAGPLGYRTKPVQRFKPNAWGFHQMHGNVCEWCRDWYVAVLPGGIDPEVTEPTSRRALRGGCWGIGGGHARSAYREGPDPAHSNNAVGFRVALVRRPATKLPSEQSGKASAGESVNLLAMIDAKKHALKGDWISVGGTLVSPGGLDSELQIPYAPPAEYVVDIVATRTGNPEGFFLGLVQEGRQFIVGLDGDQAQQSGIGRIDGKGTNENETTYRGALFRGGKPSNIRYTIRKKRIIVAFDNETIIDWNCDPARLSFPSWLHIPDKRTLSVATNTSYHITKIVLTPISGRGERISEEQGAGPRAEPTNGNAALTHQRTSVTGRRLPGLLANFYSGENFGDLIAARIDANVDWHWGLGSPGPGIPVDFFSARWTGWLRPPKAGWYTLITRSDDGARLWIDGKLLINEWHEAGAKLQLVRGEAVVYLSERPHALRIDYFEHFGQAFMSFRWAQRGGFKEQPVPTEVLLYDAEAARRAGIIATGTSNARRNS